MIKKIWGLPIEINKETGKVKYHEHFGYKEKRSVNLEEIMPVLLNKSLKYPEKVYHHYIGIKNIIKEDIKSKNITCDLIELPFGLLGIEFVKTHIYFSDYAEGKIESILEVINGSIFVLIQTKVPDSTNVEIVEVKEGEKYVVPTGAYYSFINTSMQTAIFSKISRVEDRVVDYEKLKKENGLAFYVISKNAKLEVVANPRYRGKINFKNTYKLISKPDNVFLDFIKEHISKPIHEIFFDDELDLESKFI